MLASRHGQVLNRIDLAAPLGVSVPTITQWLGVLETTAQILIIPPFYENLGKRLIKSPKVYFADSGLACHLLGIDSAAGMTPLRRWSAFARRLARPQKRSWRSRMSAFPRAFKLVARVCLAEN